MSYVITVPMADGTRRPLGDHSTVITSREQAERAVAWLTKAAKRQRGATFAKGFFQIEEVT